MTRNVRLPRPIVASVLVTLGLAAGSLAACNRDAAKQPSEAVLDVAPAPPPLPLSSFNAPIDYDFTPVLSIVERAVPQTFGSLDSLHTVGGDNGKHYAYEATRGPFTAFAEGSLLHLRSTISYAARGYYKPRFGPTLSAGCGNDNERPRLQIEMVTPITLTSNWHLKSQARLASLQPVSTADRDRCAVSIIRYDVTPQVVDAARKALISHLPDIDRKISNVDLTERFTGWWGLLNRPIRLTDEVWLLLQPERLHVGSVAGNGHVLTVQAGLDARPRIITGAEPRTDTLPLPPLSHDSISGGFHVLVGGTVDYATASRAITDALKGRKITQGGKTVIAQSVVVTPASGGKLSLAATFSGDAQGVIAFIGTPHYDQARGVLTVPDLDYDLATNSDLINAYAWLRSDALRSLLREKATIPVAPLLDRGSALLTDGLNRKIGDAVTLSATVDSVGVRGIFVTRPGVVVRADATGKAAMSVKQKQR
ncbi:MAG: DUF4403 family protein [Gemmatimonadaceae bacterium]